MPTVQKSNHSFELFDASKIKTRIQCILAPHHRGIIDVDRILDRIDKGLPDGISTTKLDELVVQACDALMVEHPYYGEVGGRVMVTRHQKTAVWLFSEVTQKNKDRLDERYVKFVKEHAQTLDATVESLYALRPEEGTELKDTEESQMVRNLYPFLNADSLKTFAGSYFQPGERYETLIMRVATAVWGDPNIPESVALANIKTAFHLMIQGYYTHATPTLFNAGTRVGQLASCFLLPVESDSIKGIFKTLNVVAQMSQAAGGIGIGMAKIRAAGSPISSGGVATGVMGLLPVYNKTAGYADQGRRRKGAFMVTIPLWHLEALDVITIQHPIQPPGRERLEHLFPALWVNELFHQRVVANGAWSFFCPADCPLLLTTFGADFDAAYLEYEKQGKARKVMPAREVLNIIAKMQLESGVPYVHNADLVNRCSNVRQIDGKDALVAHSNLCAEIVQPSTPEKPALCNLASINLRRFLIGIEGKENGTNGAKVQFDFQQLKEVVAQVVRSLDRVISVTKIFDEEGMGAHNKAVRPMGLGVQGFADVLQSLRLPWKSDGARQFNVNLFACIYWTAVKTSAQLASFHGPHDGWKLTDTGRGIFHPDHFGDATFEPENHAITEAEIEQIRTEVAQNGMRNSYLVALMPTAATSTLLNSSPSFDPLMTNLFERDTNAGSFTVLRPQIVNDLRELGKWTDETKQLMIQGGGSLKLVPGLPGWMYEVYATAHEIGGATHQLSVDRTRFVDQAQSNNTFAATIAEIVKNFVRFFPREKTFCYYTRAKQVEAKESAISRGSSGGVGAVGIEGGAGVAAGGAVCEPGCESCSG